MAAEVQRRQGADELAQARATNILDLQDQLRHLETKMRALIMEKDEQIKKLQDEVANREVELQNLRDQFNRDEKSYQNQLKQKQVSLEKLRRDLEDLQQTISTLEQKAINDTSEHTLQVVERDGKIAVLEDQRAALEIEKSSLTKEIVSLELRISDEAVHLLQLQTEKGEEVEALKAELRDKLSAPELTGDAIPIEVHIASIERGARRIQEEKLKVKMDSGRYGDGGARRSHVLEPPQGA